MTDNKYPYPNVTKAALITFVVCAVVTLALAIVGNIFWAWPWGLIVLALIVSLILGFLVGVYVEYQEDKKRNLV